MSKALFDGFDQSFCGIGIIFAERVDMQAFNASWYVIR